MNTEENSNKPLKLKNKKRQTIARGYRLKPKTHKLITKLQKKINANCDRVLWMACSELYKNLNLNI